MRGSIKYQLSTILKKYDGKGISKKTNRENGDTKGFNNQKVSDKIHSYESYRATFSTMKNIAEYAKANHNIKSIDKISNNVIQLYFLKKITEGISYRTLSNQVSHLSKIEQEFAYDKNQLQTIRELAKGILPKQRLAPRAYSQKLLDKIQLQNSALQTTFNLQRELGLRVSAATFINVNTQLSKNGELNILKFKEKGGKVSEKVISNDLVSKLKENSVEGIFKVSTSTYTKSLEKAIKNNGGKWNGTHGMRHSYAQNMLEKGYSKQSVSESMGHQREEITDTYLR